MSSGDEQMEETPNAKEDTGKEPENPTGIATTTSSETDSPAVTDAETEKKPEKAEPSPVSDDKAKAEEETNADTELSNVKESEQESKLEEKSKEAHEEAEDEEEKAGISIVSMDKLHEPKSVETDEDAVVDDLSHLPPVPAPKLPPRGLPVIAVKSKPNGRHTEGVQGAARRLSTEIVTRKRTASLTPTTDGGPKAKLGRSTSSASSNNSGGGELTMSVEDSTHDKYCWVCHKINIQFRCRVCPRSYHTKCMPDAPELKGNADEGTQCVCPECVVVMRAENLTYRSEAMKLLSMDQLMAMLKQICARMRTTQGAEAFLSPVLPEDAEDYDEYVIYPMDIAKLEKNIKQRQYGSTEAFLSDAQWIVHNSIIFNSGSSPYTAAAKRLLKVAKQELSELETCPECYTNAHQKNNWFVEACKRPHILVWAKLKGFPYWPAKAMKIKDDLADVRFFGQHDRAWVNVKDCYLYSLEQPNAAPKRSAPLTAAVEELNEHIEKLKAMFGEITLADPKTVMGPSLSVEQIQRLLPQYSGNEPSKQRNSAQVSAKTKSPMKITISSLNTSPKVVSNSAKEAASPESAEEQSESETNEMEVDEAEPEVAEEMKSEEDEKSEAESEEPKKVGKVEKKPSDVKDEEADDKDVRVPSGILASALGLKRVTRRSTSSVASSGKEDSKKSMEPVTRKSGRRISGANSVTIDVATPNTKTEVEPIDEAPEAEVRDDKLSDDSVSQDESGNESPPKLQKQSKAQDFMDQAQTKPGHRFNISKDISISAIGDDMTSSISPLHDGLRRSSTKVSATGRPITLGMKPATFKNSPTPLPLGRPRLTNNNNLKMIPPGSGLNKPATQSHTSMQMQIQQMTQGLSSTNPRIRPTVVPSGALSGQRYCLNKDGSVRPMLKATRHSQGGIKSVGNNGRSPIQGSLVRGSTPNKDGNTGQSPISSTIQSSQANSGGAITLPGGTITVTPLAPNSMSNALAIPTFAGSSVTPVNGLPTISSGNKGNSGSIARRSGNVTLPQCVTNHMTQCAKGVNEILKNTVEQIAFDILENGSSSGKIDAAVAQQEKDAIILKHSKELADLRHNHDIAMRELRLSMEGEKRRAVVEMKRQCEVEKQKVLDEVKKKQWCARCSREAQFYCCWNTSYCGYHCQEDHWPSHMGTCTQQK